MRSNLAAANMIRQHNCAEKVLYFPVSWQRPASQQESSGISMEDIPEEYRDIAEVIGLNAFVQLSYLCGGQNLYVPMLNSLKREGRDREIRARFDGGNYRTLAVQFRLSERQIRKIINGKRT